MARVVPGAAALLCIACAGTTDVEQNPAAGGGGSGGSQNVGGGTWAGGGTSGSAGAAAGGAAGSANTKPYDLPAGRTYDQDQDYIVWDGQVSFVMLQHKDQTSLPPSEGGASCSAGCNEQVTRIEDGASIWGRFKGIAGINIQLASTNEAGAGTGVFTACNVTVGSYPTGGGTSGLPGFNNLPSPAWSPPTSSECEWRVKATGGFVYFRAVTVTMPAGSGGSGGTGAGGAAGTGGLPG